MKKLMKVFLLALVFVALNVNAQPPSMNPLNYSGKMYLTAVEGFETPRYVSFDDHALLSSKGRVPTVEVTPVSIDFDKKTLTMLDKVRRFKNVRIREHILIDGEAIVIYADDVKDATKYEFVFHNYDDPYFQIIKPLAEGGMAIERCHLSEKPKDVSPAEALDALLRILQMQ